MEKKRNIISNTPLFGGLPENQLEEVAGISIQKDFQKGEFVFLEQDPATGFYIVIDGLVKIYKSSADGKEHILHIFGKGEPFGEVPVFSQGVFPANAVVLEKSSLLFFPGTDFIELISKNPSLSLNMLAILAERLRQFTVQIENLSLKEVPARLAAYLLELAKQQKTPDKVTLPFAKAQLASSLGTIPETLSRIFNKMSAMNIIRLEGKDIYLQDRSRLNDLADLGKLIDTL